MAKYKMNPNIISLVPQFYLDLLVGTLVRSKVTGRTGTYLGIAVSGAPRILPDNGLTEELWYYWNEFEPIEEWVPNLGELVVGWRGDWCPNREVEVRLYIPRMTSFTDMYQYDALGRLKPGMVLNDETILVKWWRDPNNQNDVFLV